MVHHGDLGVAQCFGHGVVAFLLVAEGAGGMGNADEQQKDEGQVEKLFHFHGSLSPEAGVLVCDGCAAGKAVWQAVTISPEYRAKALVGLLREL